MFLLLQIGYILPDNNEKDKIEELLIKIIKKITTKSELNILTGEVIS